MSLEQNGAPTMAKRRPHPQMSLVPDRWLPERWQDPLNLRLTLQAQISPLRGVFTVGGQSWDVHANCSRWEERAVLANPDELTDHVEDLYTSMYDALRVLGLPFP